MSEIKKNQHYVPRSYLKRFATPDSKGKKVIAYNIEFDKIEKNKSISNVASEEYFYDSEIDGIISQRHKVQGVENTLGDAEKYIAEFLISLEKELQRGILPDTDTVDDIAYMLYLQYVRTKRFREVFLKRVSPDFSIQAHQAIGMSQPEVFKNIVELFKNRRYILAEAARGLHFVTSDNPIIFVPNVKLDFESEGQKELLKRLYTSQSIENKRGLDFAFPISRHRVLIGIDELTTPLKIMKQQTFVKLDTAYTHNIIGGISITAHKYIIGSQKDDIDTAVELYKWKQAELAQRTEEDKERF